MPEGADAYILKFIIHDWDDEQSLAILKNCHKAMHQTSKILLLERVMPEKMEATPANQRMAMADMNMLAMPGGQERTENEYRDLLAKAGLSIAQILAIPGLDIGVIEAFVVERFRDHCRRMWVQAISACRAALPPAWPARRSAPCSSMR